MWRDVSHSDRVTRRREAREISQRPLGRLSRSVRSDHRGESSPPDVDRPPPRRPRTQRHARRGDGERGGRSDRLLIAYVPTIRPAERSRVRRCSTAPSDPMEEDPPRRPKAGVLALPARHPDPGPVPIRVPSWLAGAGVVLSHLDGVCQSESFPLLSCGTSTGAYFGAFPLHGHGFRDRLELPVGVRDNLHWPNSQVPRAGTRERARPHRAAV
jgi:hypothetical protein